MSCDDWKPGLEALLSGQAPCCANCHRENLTGTWVYCGGPERFCSSQCMADFHSARLIPRRGIEATEPYSCGVPNCHVCSGAMRSRAGKGDNS